MDKGSLYQLRSLINRRNVKASAEKDYNASDDFLNAVIKSHIVAAAMKYLNMSTKDDNPVHPKLKEDLWLESCEERKDVLQSVCSDIVLLYGTNFIVDQSSDDDSCSQLLESDKVHVLCD